MREPKPSTINNQIIEQQNKRKAFYDLFRETLIVKDKNVPYIEYNLPYSKEEFLEFIVAEKNVLLHGSPNVDLSALEPRQANDTEKVAGNKKAVYAVTDNVLPIFYAIQDRTKFDGVIVSRVWMNPNTRELEYEFVIPKEALALYPWISGVVYIFDKKQFNPEKNNNGELSGEWTSKVKVVPIAKLAVSPKDFRFLNNVNGN